MVSEDREYVERILAGEPEVFEALVRKYNRMAGAIAFGIIGDFHEAEDVTQEAFLKAFRVLHTLRDAGRFRGWFAGLVRTKALDALRKKGSRTEVGVVEDAVSVEASGLAERLHGVGQFRSLEDDPAREESKQKVLEAIRELPREDRIVVTLKHMEGLSYKEISDITGASVSSIESRLFRARQQLRKRLDPTKT
jgi:RNA polymerase sigma-70 factor (ECF subfamily)